MAAGTFLTLQEIANESLARLQNNLVAANLVNRNFDNEFASKGDTIQVKKPATFTATTFTSTITPETIVESSVLVTLDTIKDVSVEVTSKEMTLNIADFGAQVVEGAMQSLAQEVDASILGLYKNIPYFTGLASATPDSLEDFAECGRILNQNKVPFQDRKMVLNSIAQSKMVVLDAIAGLDKSGSTDALRNANIGRVLGFDTYIDQNVANHQRGTFVEASGNIVTTASAAATTIKLTNASCAGTLKIGDLLQVTMAGKVSYHVITADVSSGTNDIDVAIYPAVPYTYTAAVVLINGAATGASALYGNSMAFHKDAFCLVNRPMALPMGGANGAIANYNGLSIRVTSGYTMSTKLNTISFDILYGVKTLSPERAVRLIGKI